MLAPDDELIADLYAHADGNVGNGCWDLYDKYAARLQGATSTDATAICGVQEWTGSPHETGIEFTCSLPAEHEGWHRDAGEHDEYRWEGPSDD